MDKEHELQQLKIQFNNMDVKVKSILQTQTQLQTAFENINKTLSQLSTQLSQVHPTVNIEKQITAVERRFNVFTDDTSQNFLDTSKTHKEDVDKINTRIDNMKTEVVGKISQDVYKKTEVYGINETYSRNEINSLVNNQINKAKQEIKNYTTHGYNKNETYNRTEIDKSILDVKNELTTKYNNAFYTKTEVYNKSQIDGYLNNKADKNHGIHVPNLLNDANKFLRSDNTWQTITASGSNGYSKLESDARYALKTDIFNKTEVLNKLNDKADVNHGIHVPTLANDLSKFLRSDNTWQVIAQNNGYSKSESDIRYALKTDIYNKTDVYNKHEIEDKLSEKASVNHGVHVPTLANDVNKFLRSDNTWQTITQGSNGYSKSESDAKYALKTEIYNKADSYSKTEVNDKLNEKANINHGLHVPSVENDNSKYLRSDNTWQAINAYTKEDADSKFSLKADAVDNILNQKYITKLNLMVNTH